MADIRFEAVTRKFPGAERPAVDSLDLDIDDGQFVVLVGPSGCGKTTSLRMLSGLENVDLGRILMDAEDITRKHPSERDIAMVFQNYALYPHMTVEQNMGFHLRVAGYSRSDIRAKVLAAAEMLGLADYLDRYPRHLSGGQRQRVATGRAIVRTPKVFLFDEPLSSLDAKMRVQMRGEIKKLQAELGTTTVYVTHDQIEAMTMADRIAVLHEGRLEQFGTPNELYDRPLNTFVAGFIGSPGMNFIEGRFDGGGCLSGTGIRLDLPQGLGIDADTELVLGIRPEHVMLGDAGVDGCVDLVEPTGAEDHITIDMGASKVVAAVRTRYGLKVGQPVRFNVDPDTVHVFRKTDGTRVEPSR